MGIGGRIFHSMEGNKADSNGETKMKNIPAKIANHTAICSCQRGPDIGFPDYKYSVFLQPEYVFASGRTAGCRSGNFNSVAEFIAAEPSLKE